MSIIAQRVEEMIPNLVETIRQDYGIKSWMQLLDKDCDYATLEVVTSNGPKDEVTTEYLVYLSRYDIHTPDFSVIGKLWEDVLEGTREQYGILELNKKILLLC